MIRKKLEWKFRDFAIELGPNTLIMGVLNVTPDSFSDGGRYDDPDAAAERALELQAQGADIIDIGAESTKPGSERVSEAEELRRLIPVLKRLKGRLEIPISVDTYKVAVAEAALEHGAHIINDVSGLTWEPELAKTVLHYGAGLILNHMRGTPETWAKLPPMRDVMGEIFAELESALHRATRAGVPSSAIVVDPGIGFGKRREQNSEIIAQLSYLTKLPVPLLVGPSRKSFLAQESEEGTEFATAAAVAAAILNGASIIRVHDVTAMKAVVSVVDAILAATPADRPAEATVTRVARRDEATGQMREVVFGDEVPKRPLQPPVVKKKQEQKVEDLPLMRARKSEGDEESAAAASDASLDDETVPSVEGGDEAQAERPAREEFRRKPDEDRGAGRGERPAFGRAPGARPPYRPGGGGPPFSGGRDDYRGDRPARPPYRPAAGGPPSRDRRDDDRGGDRPSRPPYGGRRDDDRGDRPARPPYRPAAGGPPSRDRRDDDRPSRPPYRPGGGGGAPPYGGRRDDDRGDRPSRPPYRPGGGGPPSRDRREDDRPSRPPYRPGGGGGAPPYGGRRDDDRGDRPSRPPFRPKFEDRGDRPSRPPYRPGGDRDDRPSRPGGGGGGGGFAPRRPFGAGPGGGGAGRPAGPPRRREDGDDRPPRPGGGGGFAPKRPFRPGGPRDDRPPFKGGGGGKPGGSRRGPSTPPGRRRG